MAMSFNKKIITEAIQEVLAEAAISQAEKSKLKTYSVTATNMQQVKDELRQKGVKDVNNIKPGSSVTAEDHHENPNDDSDMAKSQLYAIAKYALELLQIIKDGDPLDAWVQAKITKAADYVDAVQHYLEGEEFLDANQEAPEGELAEDYEPRTKEDLVFQYLRDAWQFGALKGKDVNPDEELSTMADSLLANLPDYDSTELNDMLNAARSDEELNELFGKAKGKIVNYQGSDYEILDIDNAGTFTLKDPETEEPFYVNAKQMKDWQKKQYVEPETEEVPISNLMEAKATCCGKCGRVHAKGTECKKPYLTGKDHCRYN